MSSRLRDGLNHYVVSVAGERIRGFATTPDERGPVGLSTAVTELAATAFDARQRALDDTLREVLVEPALPILYVGDREAYASSPRRLITVSLNPSPSEFPVDDPYARFPLAAHATEPGEPYIAALDTYFKTAPDESRFSAYEAVLSGMDASYYPGAENTALHTHLCSPVATHLSWSGVGDEARTCLMEQGIPLWHRLVETLRPEAILISVARAHLEMIRFESGDPFQISHLEEENRRPYVTEGRWMDLGGHRTLLAFGQASNRPFGLVSDMNKAGIGGRIAAHLRNRG